MAAPGGGAEIAVQGPDNEVGPQRQSKHGQGQRRGGPMAITGPIDEMPLAEYQGSGKPQTLSLSSVNETTVRMVTPQKATRPRGSAIRQALRDVII